MNFFMNLKNIFSKDLAIDFGTCYTRIIAEGEGVTVYEPTIMARDTKSGEILAVGNEARDMEGKNPSCVKIIKPVENGVIADFSDASALLREFLLKACQKSIIKPRVIMTVPSNVTEVEKRAIVDTAMSAGACKCFMLESTVAAAGGASCDVSLARGMLIADIGGGRTDIAALSVGQAVISNSIVASGNSFTEATIKYVRNRYGMNIGWVTAENVKEEIGCVCQPDKQQSRRIFGTDASTGMPRSITVCSEELKDAYEETLVQITDAIKNALEDTPPELLGDILEDGILLTGGGARLYGIDRRIRMALGIKVFLADKLDLCAVIGAGAEIEKLNRKKIPFHVPSNSVNIQ